MVNEWWFTPTACCCRLVHDLALDDDGEGSDGSPTRSDSDSDGGAGGREELGAIATAAERRPSPPQLSR